MPYTFHARVVMSGERLDLKTPRFGWFENSCHFSKLDNKCMCCVQGDGGARRARWALAALAVLCACAAGEPRAPRADARARHWQRGARTLDDRAPSHFVGSVLHGYYYLPYLLLSCDSYK